MSTIVYIVVIALALALAVFAVAEEKGASIVKLDKRLVASGAVAGAMQLVSAIIGYGIGVLILSRELAANRSIYLIHVLAGFLLALIGIRMLIQGFKKHTILEHRMELIDMKADTIAFLRLGLNALFAGLAMGLIEANLMLLLACIFLASLLFVVAGYFGGRAYGGESSSRAYAIGGGLLCAVGVCLQVIG